MLLSTCHLTLTAGYAECVIPVLGSLGLAREDIVTTIQSYSPPETATKERVQRAVALVQLGVRDKSLTEVFVHIQSDKAATDSTR